MLGRSLVRRRGSGGEKSARRTPGLWERRCGARAWTGETNGARGEKNLRPAGGGSILTESGGEGARRVDAAWRQSKRERGRERGPWAWRGAMRRRVVGAAVEDGGVGATRSTWLTGGPGRDRGPIVSGWVRHGEAVEAALTGGVGSTVRPIWFSNRIKLISNGFKLAPNFDRSKRCLPVLQNFQIKYG
jgi:hypothetical protein